MIQWIWLIFSIIFFFLACFHFYQSAKKIETIESRAQVKNINGMNLGISEFITDFNKHINSQNNQNKMINIIAGIGYLVACLTAIYSLYLSL